MSLQQVAVSARTGFARRSRPFIGTGGVAVDAWLDLTSALKALSRDVPEPTRHCVVWRYLVLCLKVISLFSFREAWLEGGLFHMISTCVSH